MSIPDNAAAGASKEIFDRAEARLSVDVRDARLRQAGERGALVVIDDLSRTGFRTIWPYQLRVGDRVWLTLPGLEAKPAIVRWTKGYSIGAEFEEKLHTAVFNHLIERLKRTR